MCAFAKELTAQFKKAAYKKNIHISYEIHIGQLSICADELKLAQVISNFLDNAIRHTSYGGIIYVKIEKTMHSKIGLSVENQGEKLSEDALSKVWDIFYKGESNGNNKTTGTGLGLAISAKIL